MENSVVLKKPFKGSNLLCVLNDAKDLRYKSLNKKIKSRNKFTRLNSSILSLNLDISSLYSHFYSSLLDEKSLLCVGITSVYMFFVVHPETKAKLFKENKHGIIGNNYLILVTYDEFISEYVGIAGDVVKQELFVKNLSKYIFIFEETNWSVLQVLFLYSFLVISGGSNTKKQFLSALEFRLSQFLIGLTMGVDNKLKMYDLIINADTDAGVNGVNFRDLTLRAKKVSSIYKGIAHKTFKKASNVSDSELLLAFLKNLNNLENPELHEVIYGSSLVVCREFPGIKIIFQRSGGVNEEYSFDFVIKKDESKSSRDNGGSFRQYHTSSLIAKSYLNRPINLQVKSNKLKPFYSTSTSKSLLSNLILSNNIPLIRHFSVLNNKFEFTSKILELLYSKDSKENIQKKIEVSLLSSKTNLMSKNIIETNKINYTLLTANLTQVLFESNQGIIQLCKNYIFNNEKGKIKEFKYAFIFKLVGFDYISHMLLGKLVLILSNNDRVNEHTYVTGVLLTVVRI